jgi:hypothetical protein
MSRPGRIVLLLIAVATVGAALAAYFVYRNSTDGQGGALWGILILYGLVGAGIVWGVDAAVRRFRR